MGFLGLSGGDCRAADRARLGRAGHHCIRRVFSRLGDQRSPRSRHRQGNRPERRTHRSRSVKRRSGFWPDAFCRLSECRVPVCGLVCDGRRHGNGALRHRFCGPGAHAWSGRTRPDYRRYAYSRLCKHSRLAVEYAPQRTDWLAGNLHSMGTASYRALFASQPASGACRARQAGKPTALPRGRKKAATPPLP